jgi:hypothetical protein
MQKIANSMTTPLPLPAKQGEYSNTIPPVYVVPDRPDVLHIPRKIHRIWVGSKPIPEQYQRFWATWIYHHPGWEWRTWRDEDIAELGPECARLCRESRNPAEMSDVMRYYIICQEGGVYVDTDFEAFRNIEPALFGYRFVSAWEAPNIVASAFFAGIPQHPNLEALCRNLDGKSIDTRLNQVHTAGPLLFTKLLDITRPDTFIHPTAFFYPFPYGTVSRGPTAYPEAFAGHHWAHTWQSDWNTITFWIDCDGGDVVPRTLASITPHMGPNDRIKTSAARAIKTTHFVRLNNGDTFVPGAIERIRKILRHAANYAANDFVFRDDAGGAVRVEASLEQGNPETRIVGEPVLMRTKSEDGPGG